MAANSTSDWSNWREQEFPWDTLYANLSKEQTEEFRRFVKQNRLELELEKRKDDFHGRMRLQIEAFEEAERHQWLDTVYSFGYALWSKGIDEIRRTTVPAYTFLKFRKLPVEIQLRIWSLAASVHEPQFHTIGSISNDETQGFLPDSYPYCIKSSSGIDCREITWPVQRPPVPSILHVCQQSRGEGLKTYTRLAVKYHSCSQPGCELYFNVLYDIFYIGNEPWEGFKILVDILIKFNTTRPLQTKLRTGMDQLRNLRNILVDLNIFGAVPVATWSKFPKLETLSIVFYPHKEIQDAEPNGYFNRRLAFTRPQNGRHEKRASWVVRMAKSALEAVKKNTTPDWKLPTIEAVLRSDVIRYGDHYGSDSEEDDELSEDGSTGDDDEIVEVDDSTWYQQAAARMTHEVPKEELST